MTVSELLNADEGKTLEFKQDASSSRNLLKTLVAFANTAGGTAVIGVADKTREPLGVDNPLDEEERLCSVIADSIHPRLVPNIEMTTVDGNTLLVIEVFLSNSRPHYLRSEGPDAGVYVRLGSSNRQADRELIAELKRSAEGVAFDELPMPELSVDDLNVEAAREAFGNVRELDGKSLLTLYLAEPLPLSPQIGGHVERKSGVESGVEPGVESDEQVGERGKTHVEAQVTAQVGHETPTQSPPQSSDPVKRPSETVVAGIGRRPTFIRRTAQSPESQTSSHVQDQLPPSHSGSGIYRNDHPRQAKKPPAEVQVDEEGKASAGGRGMIHVKLVKPKAETAQLAATIKNNFEKGGV